MMNTAKKRIWAIAGGKGGVGKSFLSTNLSIDLASQGYNVALIDADFGGANLHTFFGVGGNKSTISDYLHSNQIRFEDILVPTGINNLYLASGAHDTMGSANPKPALQSKLIKAIDELQFDHVIIDLGAGIAPFTLDLFLMASTGILVTAPEPTSVENTYRFIKAAFYRKLKRVITHPEVRNYLEEMTESHAPDAPKTPSDLIRKIMSLNVQAGEELKYELAAFRPKLVLNQVRNPTDVRVGFSMKQACMKFFEINLDYIGFVEFDNTALQSIRSRQPVMTFAPDSQVSHCIRRVGHNIRQNYHLVPTNS